MARLRTALEGHDLVLAWSDFQGAVPNPRIPGEDAYTEARFDLAYDYDYDTEHATQGYRINQVHVRVTLERAKMWAVASGQTAALLKHEQGHYDIVALLARDLFGELTAWNAARPPKRFRKDVDLKRTADGLSRGVRTLAAQLAGLGQDVGVYDKQTNHGQDAKAQDRWDKGVAAARTNGTPLTTALSGLRLGGP